MEVCVEVREAVEAVSVHGLKEVQETLAMEELVEVTKKEYAALRLRLIFHPYRFLIEMWKAVGIKQKFDLMPTRLARLEAVDH